MSIHPDIAAHYAQGLERDRLRTWGRLEAVRTWALLRRLLPDSPATIIDVGGAEGAYALPLAEMGYGVHLLDPVASHVEAAVAASAAQAHAPLASVQRGDARLLPYADDVADVALLLGPLYHLVESSDRAKALSEARRVLRPGGLLMAAAISRFASTLDGIHSGSIHDPRFEAIVKRDLHDGVHRNPDVEGHPEWFTLAYFHTPDELGDEARRAGFHDVEVLAIEGVAAGARIDDDLDDPKRCESLLRAVERVEREPSLLGASPHLALIATAP